MLSFRQLQLFKELDMIGYWKTWILYKSFNFIWFNVINSLCSQSLRQLDMVANNTNIIILFNNLYSN